MPAMPENQGGLHESVRYEKSDVSLLGIVTVGFALFVVGVVAHIVLLGVFNAFRSSADKSDPSVPLLYQTRPRLDPPDLGAIPEPRVEVSELIQLEELRREEEALLQTYGWVDRDKRIIRIPIARAMKILAESGRDGLQKRGQRPAGGKP